MITVHYASTLVHSLHRHGGHRETPEILLRYIPFLWLKNLRTWRVHHKHSQLGQEHNLWAVDEAMWDGRDFVIITGFMRIVDASLRQVFQVRPVIGVPTSSQFNFCTQKVHYSGSVQWTAHPLPRCAVNSVRLFLSYQSRERFYSNSLSAAQHGLSQISGYSKVCRPTTPEISHDESV